MTTTRQSLRSGSHSSDSMPRLTRTRGLRKHHVPGCKHVDQPARCACPWYGRYKDVEVNLAKFKRKPVTTKWEAELALGELRASIENGTYRHPRKPTNGGGSPARPHTLGELVDRYIEHHEDEGGFSETSGHARMLTRLKREVGHITLATLTTDRITRWLRDQARPRRWKPRTWNYHRSAFSALCKFAVEREWMPKNPVVLVPKKGSAEAKEPERLTPEQEQKLLDACALLDNPDREITRNKITQAVANEIRVRVKAGESRSALARAHGVSYDTVRLIEQGKIWTPFQRPRGTHGREMRRRVLMALRTGARAGEILQITPDMIDVSDPGCYVVTLEATKGGKLRQKAETEYLYITDPELRAEVLARVEALRENPEGRRCVFGKEDGRQVKSISWERLFDLAGIPRGRVNGYVWHHTRHEAISRFADHSDKNVWRVQKLARHRDVRTTMRYVHADREGLIELARKAQGGAS